MTAKNILCDLINFKTDIETISHTECCHYVCDLLAKNGFIFKLVYDGVQNHIIAISNKYKLENINNGLVLFGHLDVVKADETKWNTPPFSATIKDDKVYGRGTVDMKSFSACVLNLLPEIYTLNYPVILVFTFDEETLSNGIPMIQEFFKNNNILPNACIVGEPTNFNICVGTKGCKRFETIITGKSAHSSAPELGVNAIYIASHLVNFLEKEVEILKENKSTLSVGEINGGTQANIVADKAVINWLARVFDKKILETMNSHILNEALKLQEKYPGSTIITEEKEELVPFYNENKVFANFVKSIVKTDFITLPYSTEAGYMQDLGIETIVFGCGDQKLAHTDNEFITITDLKKYNNILKEIFANYKP